MVTRNTFPQLPWRHVNNPKTLVTDDGDTIFVDGWYRLARKIHYSCDMFFALSWALITGFDSPLPWFYPVFFAVMIGHRAMRDITKCKNKYGKTWDEYERQVPSLFIPVSSYYNFHFETIYSLSTVCALSFSDLRAPMIVVGPFLSHRCPLSTSTTANSIALVRIYRPNSLRNHLYFRDLHFKDICYHVG